MFDKVTNSNLIINLIGRQWIHFIWRNQGNPWVRKNPKWGSS
jgi:hypothetical protein